MKREKNLKSNPEWEYGIDDSDRFWACINGSNEIARLEDVIRIACLDIRVSCFVELTRKNVEIKISDIEANRHQTKVEAFLLLAEYTFRLEEKTANVCKVYVFGRAQRGGKIHDVDLDIANQRLRVDYDRLRSVNIKFKENYFEDDIQ